MGFWDDFRGGFRHGFHNTPADNAQLQERMRLALLVQEKMRDWESADPENVSYPQCFVWGRAFLLEQGLLNPHVAESICEAAYIDILADKIRLADGAEAVEAVQREEAELSAKVQFSPNIVERYVDVIEWRYQTLRDVAMKSPTALTGEIARKLYEHRRPRPR